MPKNAKISRIGMSRLALRALLGATALGAVCTSGDANAQIAGTTARPLPNVLLLVDNSGSMERMVDNSLPKDNRGQGRALGALQRVLARRGIEPQPLGHAPPGADRQPPAVLQL